MKIVCKILSGIRYFYDGDFSESACPYAVMEYYSENKSRFSVGYCFVVDGITLKVTSITEKQNQKVRFSFARLY